MANPPFRRPIPGAPALTSLSPNSPPSRAAKPSATVPPAAVRAAASTSAQSLSTQPPPAVPVSLSELESSRNILRAHFRYEGDLAGLALCASESLTTCLRHALHGVQAKTASFDEHEHVVTRLNARISELNRQVLNLKEEARIDQSIRNQLSAGASKLRNDIGTLKARLQLAGLPTETAPLVAVSTSPAPQTEKPPPLVVVTTKPTSTTFAPSSIPQLSPHNPSKPH